MRKYKKSSKRTGKYKSKLEAKIARRLGKRATYETESLDYIQPAKKRKYTPDFVVIKKDETKLFLEVKGFLRREDQIKMRLVKECNPSLDIRMFFPKDGRIHGSQLLNSEWCTKYGFDYAIDTIPKEWLS